MKLISQLQLSNEELVNSIGVWLSRKVVAGRTENIR